MHKVIEGKAYNTETAIHITNLTCNYYGSDFEWHKTALYRTAKGAWFLSGEGNALSMWGRDYIGGGRVPGEGIKVLDDHEAMAVLEEEGETDLIEEYFAVEEA